jgi:hypothetical protein
MQQGRKHKEMRRNTKPWIGKIRKAIFKILLLTPLCPYILSNIWTIPSCISPPQLRTSYKESNTIKFETKINLEPYSNFYQSLNSNKRSFPNSLSSPRKPTLLDQLKPLHFILHAYIVLKIHVVLWFHVGFNLLCND